MNLSVTLQIHLCGLSWDCSALAWCSALTTGLRWALLASIPGPRSPHQWILPLHNVCSCCLSCVATAGNSGAAVLQTGAAPPCAAVPRPGEPNSTAQHKDSVWLLLLCWTCRSPAAQIWIIETNCSGYNLASWPPPSRPLQSSCGTGLLLVTCESRVAAAVIQQNRRPLLRVFRLKVGLLEERQRGLGRVPSCTASRNRVLYVGWNITS